MACSGGVCILVENSLQFKLIYHKEIIPGKIQALKLNIDDHDVVLINVYGPNNDDASFSETLYDFLGENDEEEYIIGGDFNTVLNLNLDTLGGIKGTHQKCRDKIIASIDNFDLADIWRVFNPSARQYTLNNTYKCAYICGLISPLILLRSFSNFQQI